MHHEKTRKIVLVKNAIEDRFGTGPRGRKRKFASIDDTPDTETALPPTSEPTEVTERAGIDDINLDDDEELPDFALFVNGMIAESEANNTPEDPSISSTAGGGVTGSSPPSRVSTAPMIPSPPSSRHSLDNPDEEITLQYLFDYPPVTSSAHTGGTSPRMMQDYWRKAREGFQLEVDYHEREAASRETEQTSD
jgi:hypothetical protein